VKGMGVSTNMTNWYILPRDGKNKGTITTTKD